MMPSNYRDGALRVVSRILFGVAVVFALAAERIDPDVDPSGYHQPLGPKRGDLRR